MKVINKLILGTAQFGLEYGICNSKGKPSDEIIFEILNIAFDSGVRILDTAVVYGNAHQIIGAYHNSHRSSSFKVNTKIPKGLLVDNYESEIYQYLEDLQISQVNTLMLHSFEDYFHGEAVKLALESLKKQRLVQQIGVSVYTNDQLTNAINEDLIEVIQLPFNLLDNWQHRGELITKAKERQKEIHIRSVFLQGLFFMNLESTNSVVQKLKSYLCELHQIAAVTGMSIGELAIRYGISFAEVDGMLIGVDEVSQLKNNVILFKKGALGCEIRDKISELIVPFTEWLNPSNW
jgi:aryl-alcohol dehydrogenase-like predicted oxidoreductase